MTPLARFALLAAASLAPLAAHAENPAVAPGKQRAAASPLQWDVREAGHPVLGNIRFAVTRTPVETRVGARKVYSRAYVSCQRANGKLAIELTNSVAPDDPSGLRPRELPRLACHRPEEGGKLVREELLANWDVSEIGDAMTRGFRPFPLRECAAIAVEQDVVLPEGWGAGSVRIEFEIPPYGRELDAVFAACGEPPAYAAGSPSPAAAAPAPRRSAAPAEPAGWREARVTASGKTNVRAGPSLRSAVVVTLHPGSVVLVQRAGGEWWRVKSRSGTPFEGYVRQDRLAFR